MVRDVSSPERVRLSEQDRFRGNINGCIRNAAMRIDRAIEDDRRRVCEDRQEGQD